jgi:peptidase E
MKKILLTSAGLTENMKKVFLAHIQKHPNDIKVIFVPTAAIVDDIAREGIAVGITELLKMGINKDNILLYNLNNLLSSGYIKTYSNYIDYNSLPYYAKLLSSTELERYDAIVFCGGYTEILLDEINRTGFNVELSKAVNNGLFYVGISAGSMVAAGNLPNNLGFIKNAIIPHCETGTACGNVPHNSEIHLTNSQAIWIYGNKKTIIA